MKVREFVAMKRPPVTIGVKQNVETAMRMLIENKIGSLIVVDTARKPIGIITERDIFHLAFRYRGDMMDIRVKETMSDKLVIGSPDDDIDYIAEMIAENRIRHVPIMENGELVSIISIRDIVTARAEQLMQEGAGIGE